jgi:hypothetical protein
VVELFGVLANVVKSHLVIGVALPEPQSDDRVIAFNRVIKAQDLVENTSGLTAAPVPRLLKQ